MATFSHNGSAFTVSIVNAPTLSRSSVPELEANAIAAIRYLADYVRWKGVLDFAIIWDKDETLGDYWKLGGPGFAAYGGVSSTGRTHALSEATTGIDSNGSDYDAGMWVAPDNNRIFDYGRDLYIDDDPNPGDDDLSNGQRDFLSTFLHESIHGLGFWSTAQHGDAPGTTFDQLTKLVGGQYFFVGPKTQEVFGAPLPLALTGSRDHYSDSLPYEIDLMREYGHHEKWQISNIDLAMLQDLGYEIIKWFPDETDSSVLGNDDSPVPGNGDSLILGIQFQETVTIIQLPTPLTLGNLQVTRAVVGTLQNDVITGSDAGEALAGGKGKDQMTGGGGPDAFLFETPGEFGKKSRDTVTDFDPDEGDKVVISHDAFEGVTKVKLDVATGKKDVKKAASSKKTFIYDEKKGMLYFNENGKKDGFGDGGEFVKLLGSPDMENRDFVIV